MIRHKYFQLDFADSSYERLEMNGKTLTVYLTSWDAKTLRIVFFHPIRLSYNTGSFPENIFEIQGGSPFLQDTITAYYEKIPQNHPFKHFQIIDIEDFPFIEIVAEGAQGFKE